MKCTQSKYPVNVLLSETIDIEELKSFKFSKEYVSVYKYQNDMNKAYGFYKPISKMF